MTTPHDESTVLPSALREAHLRDYWKIVWQGRWTVVAIFLLVVGVTAVWTFLQTPVYRATAVVEVQPQARQLTSGSDISGLGSAGYGWFAENKYHNTQVEIIRSRSVAQEAVDRLGLRSHPMFAEASDPVAAFRGMIQVVPRRETGLIEISISGAKKDEITQWVNAVSDAYVNRNIRLATEKMEKAAALVEKQFQELQQSVIAAEEQRLELLEETEIFDSEGQEEIIRDQLKTYNTELNKVRIELSQLEGTLGRIRQMNARGADLSTLPELADDAQLKELQRSKNELQRQLEAAQVELRPNHPRVEEFRNQLASVEQRMQERTSEFVGTIQTRYDLAKRKEGFLETQIADVRTFSLEVARESSKVGVVQSEAETRKRIFDLIAKTMNEIQVSAQLLTNNVQVLDDAVPPLYPVKPRKKLNLAIGGMLGLFLGIAGAFFLDYLDNTFRTPDDVEKFLGTAVLGVIPKLGDEEGTEARAVKEAYQSLRTSVIFASKNRQRKVVLLTSTGPQEGKSSTTANLARALAAAGDRVIVVDCDLRRPTQHLVHQLDRDSGVTNYLAAADGEADWRVYVKPVGPGQLDVLTSGPIPPNAPELLGSERFTRLIGELRAGYDWVLIDSPPAATLADTTLLASLVDMIVLVVQHNRTDRDLVVKTLRRLHGVNPAVAGAVLNNVDIDRTYHKDYYYAGYYYYGEDEEGKKSRRRSGKSEPTAGVG